MAMPDTGSSWLRRSKVLPARFRGLTREALWRLRPSSVEALPPSWPLEPNRLERMLIVWPRTYDWPHAHRWLDTLLSGLQTHVSVRFAELSQPYHHVVLFHLELDGSRHEVAIDYADRPELNDECRGRCPLYFKMQFLDEGYGDRSVVPGGFPPSWASIYGYLGRLRRMRARADFSTDVYGRFSTAWAEETRHRAVRLLGEQEAFRYQGGFEMVRYSRYLAEVAQAKICIDLPGKGDLCFRLIDYLSIGSCVIGPQPSTRLHAPLRHGVNIVYCADDLSDLVPLCEQYLTREEERESIAQAARAHFDRYLESTQWAAYYLHTAVQRLG